MSEPEMGDAGRAARRPPVFFPEGGMGLLEGLAGGARPMDRLALEVLIRVMRDAVLDLDGKGRVRLWSSGAARLFGHAPAEALGRPLADLVAVDGQDLERAMADLLAAKTWPAPERVIDVLLRRADGAVFAAEMTFSPYLAGRQRRFMVVVRDHAGVRALELALEASRDRERLAMEGAIVAIGRMVEARDPYTAGHQQRTARLARAMALHMGLGAEQAEGIFLGAAVHDIGKIDVPAEILARPAALRKGEREIVQRHAAVGYNIMKDIHFPWPVAVIVRQHHERLDGSGYPNGLHGDEISMEARIVAVADAVESMSSHRPYCAARPLPEAVAEIKRLRGIHYDPDVVDSCTRLIEAGGHAMDAFAP